MQFHSIADNAFTVLESAVLIGDATIVVTESVMDDLDTPFYADIVRELIEVTGVALNTPSAGKSTWTVTRAVQGDAAAYDAGIPVLQRVYAIQTHELHDLFRLVEKGFEQLTGANDGIFTDAAKSGLKPTDAGSNVVSVAAGTAIVSAKMVGSHAAQTVTMSPPGSGSRTDLIQMSSANALSIKTGSTTPDADNIAIAEVAMTDGAIVTVTDARNFI